MDSTNTTLSKSKEKALEGFVAISGELFGKQISKTMTPYLPPITEKEASNLVKKPKSKSKRRKYFSLDLRSKKRWLGKNSKCEKDGHPSVSIETPEGIITLRAKYIPEEKMARFTVTHDSFMAYHHEKLAVGFFGKAITTKPNKNAGARIAKLESLLVRLISPLDEWMDAAYKSTGERRPYPPNIPANCNCGKHKTVGGIFTCKDLHKAVAEARQELQL